MNINKFNSEGYVDLTTYYALRNIERENRIKRAEQKAKFGYRPLVFICSSYAGDIELNIQRARRYSRFAVSKNCIPFAPHLLFPQFVEESDEYSRQLGIFMGKVILKKCKEVWVFGNKITSGMAEEIRKAKHLNIPVRYFNDKCEEVCKYD